MQMPVRKLQSGADEATTAHPAVDSTPSGHVGVFPVSLLGDWESPSSLLPVSGTRASVLNFVPGWLVSEENSFLPGGTQWGARARWLLR